MHLHEEIPSPETGLQEGAAELGKKEGLPTHAMSGLDSGLGINIETPSMFCVPHNTLRSILEKMEP